MKNKKQKGITLIALVITIIVMLILATVVVNVGINGGIFEYAGDAKDSIEIANEKETIQKAVVLATSTSKTGRISKEGIQKSIDNVTNENKAKVYEMDEEYVIIFESKRAYTIDSKGKIKEMAESYENPGKKFMEQVGDSNYGTEEKPYEINCIEDLVDLTYAVNGLEVLEDGTVNICSTYNQVNQFSGKYIVLNRTLSFSSELSYEEANRRDYGDINGNGEIEELITELTTGTGWIPIGGSGHSDGRFMGTFNGRGKAIKNMYINNEEETGLAGLFGYVQNGIVTNIKVTGEIHCNSGRAGGIIAYHQRTDANTYYMDNCSFGGTIENQKSASPTGGIIGQRNGYLDITNSYNEGNITGINNVGGIVGSGADLISNCYNTGEINGGLLVGGIIGNGGKSIENCYNTGKIVSSEGRAGGIVGQIYATSNAKIYRCYNTGDVTGAGNTGGILGYNYSSSYLTVEECYNTGNITGTDITSGIVGMIAGSYSRILNCYNTGDITGARVAGIGWGFSAAIRSNMMNVSCYNTGLINGTTKYSMQFGTSYNSYYLSTCGASDDTATPLGEDELKTSASTLDKSFTINDEDNTVTISEEEIQNVWVADSSNINGGYPILSWQIEAE